MSIMKRKSAYIADSSILSEFGTPPMCSIISLVGENEAITRVLTSISDFFGDSVFNLISFESWYKTGDNSDRLLNFLMSMQDNELICSFNAYVSDHDYLMFVVYANTLFRWGKIKEIYSDVDCGLIYQGLEPTLLAEIGNSENISILEKFNHCFEDLLCKQLSKDKFSQYKEIKFPIEVQVGIWDKLKKRLASDLPILDYLQYLELLEKEQVFSKDSDVYAVHHVINTLEYLRQIDDNMGASINTKWNIVELELNNKFVCAMTNLIAILNYTWSILHQNKSIEAIHEQDRILIIMVWLLFQSNFSKWMITSEDFFKIKNCYVSLLNDK